MQKTPSQAEAVVGAKALGERSSLVIGQRLPKTMKRILDLCSTSTFTPALAGSFPSAIN
jgi:hypothetical protein